jgi:hypothetical protein
MAEPVLMALKQRVQVVDERHRPTRDSAATRQSGRSDVGKEQISKLSLGTAIWGYTKQAGKPSG